VQDRLAKFAHIGLSPMVSLLDKRLVGLINRYLRAGRSALFVLLHVSRCDQIGSPFVGMLLHLPFALLGTEHVGRRVDDLENVADLFLLAAFLVHRLG
jgi:hypothetical protein